MEDLLHMIGGLEMILRTTFSIGLGACDLRVTWKEKNMQEDFRVCNGNGNVLTTANPPRVYKKNNIIMISVTEGSRTAQDKFIASPLPSRGVSPASPYWTSFCYSIS